MAEQEPQLDIGEDVEDEPETNYKKPEEKSMQEILSQDKEDESLQKYKASLLGQVEGDNVFWPDKGRVIVKTLAFCPDDRDPLIMDLEGDVKQVFTIKEGVKYRLKFTFCVQREIVTGLKYEHKVTRMGKCVEKLKQMVGSYGPSREEKEFKTPVEETPTGMLSRGTYKVESKFVDDDGQEYIKWNWKFEIAKSWD